MNDLIHATLFIEKSVGDQSGVGTTLGYLSHCASRRGEHALAIKLAQESTNIYRALGDPQELAWGLNNLGRAIAWQGDLPRARSLLEESLTIFRSLQAHGAIANTLDKMGEVEFAAGDYAAARALLEESGVIHGTIAKDVAIQYYRRILGYAALLQGDYAQARLAFQQSLNFHVRFANRVLVGASLAGIASVLHAQGKNEQAASLLGFATQALTEEHFKLAPIDQAQYDLCLASVRAHLDPSDFAAAWARGEQMSSEEAMAMASESTSA